MSLQINIENPLKYQMSVIYISILLQGLFTYPSQKPFYNLSILCGLGLLCLFFSVPHLLSELYFDIIKCKEI